MKYLFRNEEEWALVNLKRLGLQGLPGAWCQFCLSLHSLFADVLDVEIISHDLPAIRQGLAVITSGCKTISLDPCISGDHNLYVSRVFDPSGMDLGIGERPGYPNLEIQIESIPAGEYILVDDDVYSGRTIEFVLPLFRKQQILRVACGIKIGNVPVDFVYQYQPEEIVDLAIPRDFLFGANGGGLVIKDGGEFYRIPYIYSPERCSIPRDATAFFAKEVLLLNRVFWSLYPKVCLEQVDPFLCKYLGRFFDKKTPMILVVQELYENYH